MEIVTANVAGKARKATFHGRSYLVAPMTLIVPGVLNGSQGPLYYPLEEVRKDPHAWDHIPIVVYHPMKGGKPVSARRPEILEQSGIGHLFNSHANGKLTAEGWFDVERTRAVDARVLTALETNASMELSTGLTLEQEPAPQGAVFNSPGGPRPYVAIARNYKPDHLAILPDQKGACSVLDGCGVLVNHESPLARRSSYFEGLVLLTNAYNPNQPRVAAGKPGGGRFASVKQAGAAVKKAEGRVAKAQLTLEKAKKALKVEKGGLVVAKRGLAEAKSREKVKSPAAKKAISKASQGQEADVKSYARQISLLEKEAVAKGRKGGFKHSTEEFEAHVNDHLTSLNKSLNKQQVVDLLKEVDPGSRPKTKAAGIIALRRLVLGRRQTAESLLT